VALIDRWTRRTREEAASDASEGPICRLCGAETRALMRQRVLGKHDVRYGQCPRCDLIQTEAPYWLDEAYSNAISQLDTGAMHRTQETSRLTALLARVIGLDGTCLDYGGGHGVFVRMMRDLGYDFRWLDKYAENLFAIGFEGTVNQRYSLVTAFEVLEHFADVREDLDALFGPRHDFVLVGTVLHAGHQDGWWYYLPESGQHVAFYSRRTLDWVGQHYDYDVIAADELSLFVRRDLALGRVRRALVRRMLEQPGAVRGVPRFVISRGSLIDHDHALGRARLQDSRARD
jgi:Methyltransferase domain